jgi:hypothetical protein
MKNLNTRWLIAAAALAVAVGSASAQTPRYRADIPVSFRAGSTTMLPGSYEINLAPTASGGIVARVTNLDTHRVAQVFAARDSDTLTSLKKEGKAAMSFDCGGGQCQLTGLWGGTNDSGFRFMAPKHLHNEARMASLNIELTKAE